jgi:integrase
MADRHDLTLAFAKAVKPTGKQQRYWDEAIRGLCLLVSASGKKSWYFMHNPYGGRDLGRITETPLREARRLAAEMKLEIRRGVNPFKALKVKAAAERAAITPPVTLKEAWPRYVEEVLSRKSPSHRKEADRAMRQLFLAAFGKRAPADISAKELLAFRQKHEAERPYVMRHLKTYVSTFYDWMADDPLCSEAVNGFRPNFGKIRHQQAVRTRKLTKAEDIGALYRCLDALPSRAAALATKFLLLSNRRAKEVREMHTDQIDLMAARWTFTSTKGRINRKITQPLTPTMIVIIKEALGNREDGYVFSSTLGEKPIWLGSKFNAALIAAAGINHISFHDIRRTVSTGMEELRIPHRVISLTAGHYDRGIEAHYQQAEKAPLDDMRDAYLEWENFVHEAADAHP